MSQVPGLTQNPQGKWPVVKTTRQARTRGRCWYDEPGDRTSKVKDLLSTRQDPVQVAQSRHERSPPNIWVSVANNYRAGKVNVARNVNRANVDCPTVQHLSLFTPHLSGHQMFSLCSTVIRVASKREESSTLQQEKKILWLKKIDQSLKSYLDSTKRVWIRIKNHINWPPIPRHVIWMHFYEMLMTVFII